MPGISTNYAAITTIFVVGVVIAVVVWSYFQLRSHRADAVAMGAYRKLTEETAANQQELGAQLARLTEKVQAVEQMMRDVG